MSGTTREVLVLTTATQLASASSAMYRKSVEVQNLGPNPIFVAFSEETAVATKARRLATYDTLSVSGETFTHYAITTVNQVTGGATIVMEMEP